MRETHATQNVGRLGELNIVIADDLDAVAPRIAEVEEAAIYWGDASSQKSAPGRLFIIDNKTEMAAIIRGLRATLLKGDELVTQIDEGHTITLATKLELEETAVKGQRLLDKFVIKPTAKPA
jgi:hypothetical protein